MVGRRVLAPVMGVRALLPQPLTVNWPAPSSRGPGHGPLKAETRVRIPLGPPPTWLIPPGRRQQRRNHRADDERRRRRRRDLVGVPLRLEAEPPLDELLDDGPRLDGMTD